MNTCCALLEESFLPHEAGRWYVSDPGRAQDLERLRERALLREFRTCVDAGGPVYETAPASYRSPNKAIMRLLGRWSDRCYNPSASSLVGIR